MKRPKVAKAPEPPKPVPLPAPVSPANTQVADGKAALIQQRRQFGDSTAATTELSPDDDSLGKLNKARQKIRGQFRSTVAAPGQRQTSILG